MRPQIPNPNAVDSAFRLLRKRLAAARKRINIAAAREMKADEYEAAKGWMSVGSSVTDFAERVDAFAEEWKRLAKATRIAARANHAGSDGESKQAARPTATPAWKWCVPALKAAIARGGTADMAQVISDLDTAYSSTLPEKDRLISRSRRVPQWHLSVRRAHRQSQREGWIEKRQDETWKVTQKGKAVAAEEA